MLTDKAGRWLKGLRLAKGATQLDTSLDTNVPLKSLQKIENCEIHPRLNHFEALCTYFGVDPKSYWSTNPDETD